MKIAITDGRIPTDAIRTLERLGAMVITLPSYSRLSEAVCSHTDMLIASFGKQIITYADYCDCAAYVFTDLLSFLPEYKIHFSSAVPSERYPSDVGLNSLVMGKRIYTRIDSADGLMKEVAKALGYTLVGVNQGYPACTTLKLNDNAVITADKGMARRLSEDGIRVTLIREGYISLPPYDHGFIGGAAGVDGMNVCFIGDITTHPDHEAILAAIETEGMRAMNLCSGELRDLGGILFLS